VTFFGDDLDPHVPAEQRDDPAYVRARGVLEDVDLFDAGFFGIAPREADVMDPQQRVLFEVAWEALENAGHVPDTFQGTIGVFAGKYNDTYWSKNVATRPDAVRGIGEFQAMLANEKDYVATRLAHRLDLRGPALSIHTACSTSLVTIVEAMRSLQRGECDLALAGGASITIPVKSGYLYQEGSMLSPDGHTRPFDEGAQGTVFSDGVGIVVLRRLDDALASGDTIHAVLLGGALNNDGGAKASFTAPSAVGQATVIAMAQEDAGVDPRTISYVEAHGTATPLGDPIEVEALTRAFRRKTSDVGFCALGSVKSNFGHTVIAAGVAGVIKTALALSHEAIPPTLHFTAPNRKLALEQSPFRVPATLEPWKRSSAPRRAGVSSFGVGGTNAHVVMEEAPLQPPSTDDPGPQLLVLSARSAAALDRATRTLGERLATAAPDGAPALADVAFTLQMGRKAFAHRRAIVAATREEAAEALLRGKAPQRRARGEPPKVVLLFPGQVITLPGGVSIQQFNLMEAIQPALTPLMPVFDIIDTVVAVFNCVKAIPDSLGPPPDPTALAACIPELAEKVSKLLKLIPQLSLPYTIIGIIDLVIDTLRQARDQLLHLQQQMQQILGAIDRATELEDAGLMAITSCAQANVATEAANVGKALASLGKLIGILNIFLGMVGAPEVPDLSNLAGRPLDEVVPPIDAIVKALQDVRGAIPVP
jgi:acyl transferase domain-containing protein